MIFSQQKHNTIANNRDKIKPWQYRIAGIFMHNTENIYKSNVPASGIRDEIKQDIEQNMAKFNDPVVIGEMLYKVLQERENTNRILKNILSKLETMETRMQSGTETPTKTEIAQVKQQTQAVKDILLPEIDEAIYEFVKKLGKTTAEEVRAEFKYKGKNAACARLNRLFELNLLGKKQVGKKYTSCQNNNKARKTRLETLCVFDSWERFYVPAIGGG